MFENLKNLEFSDFGILDQFFFVRLKLSLFQLGENKTENGPTTKPKQMPPALALPFCLLVTG